MKVFLWYCSIFSVVRQWHLVITGGMYISIFDSHKQPNNFFFLSFKLWLAVHKSRQASFFSSSNVLSVKVFNIWNWDDCISIYWYGGLFVGFLVVVCFLFCVFLWSETLSHGLHFENLCCKNVSVELCLFWSFRFQLGLRTLPAHCIQKGDYLYLPTLVCAGWAFFFLFFSVFF